MAKVGEVIEVFAGVKVDVEQLTSTLNSEQIRAVMNGIAEVISAQGRGRENDTIAPFSLPVPQIVKERTKMSESELIAWGVILAAIVILRGAVSIYLSERRDRPPKS